MHSPSEQLKKCQQENAEKSEFLSMVTHQLRTPLSGNKWAFKMLLDGDLGELNEEQRTVIEKGLDSTQRMINLLQEIIHANKHNTWDLQYNMKKASLCALIHEIVQEFNEEARLNDVEVTIVEPHDNDCALEFDPEKFRFVIQNLLENSIKYSTEKGIVEITIDPQPEALRLSIADNGIGIPADDQEHISTKFFRASNTKQSKNGTGLGLFTAYKIVERHNGAMHFESTEGEGTTFYITLPYSQSA